MSQMTNSTSVTMEYRDRLLCSLLSMLFGHENHNINTRNTYDIRIVIMRPIIKLHAQEEQFMKQARLASLQGVQDHEQARLLRNGKIQH